MTFSSIFAQFVAFVGGIALQWRKLSGTTPAPAWGQAPAIPEAKPQGALPTLKMPTARGWSEGQKPTAAPGLKVNAFATGLDHPRWIEVLPNGDVLIAEATQIAGAPRSVFHYAMQATMRRAAALGESAPTASRCCATRTATASPKCAAPSWRTSASRSAWRWSATPSMSATPTA